MSNGIQTAWQVRGGRPDMSKARGARPPLIIRPSGSGIPKDAGKPGGAGMRLLLHWRTHFSAVSRVEILHWVLTGDLSVQSYRQAFCYQMTASLIFR